MSTRSIANRVYDRARVRAFEDMIETYPDLWRFLLEKTLADYRDPASLMFQKYDGDNNKLYDKSRHDAKRALREARPAAFELLMWGWSAHYKVELGWVDERRPPERLADGRFKPVNA